MTNTEDRGFGTYMTVNGARLFVDPTDKRAEALLRRGGQLHPAAIRLWQCAIHEAAWDWIVDIGANYGEMLVGAELPAGTDVAAVEPNPRVLPYLVHSLRHAVPHAKVLPCAVSDVTGSVTMYEDLTWSGNSTLAGEWIADRAYHTWRRIGVQALSLDSLFAEIGVERDHAVLMKMDIEGYEAKVLRSALGRLRAAPQCAVLVEIVRFSEAELVWLLNEFVVSLLDARRDILVDMGDVSVADFRTLIGRGDVYRRDVIAVPRKR